MMVAKDVRGVVINVSVISGISVGSMSSGNVGDNIWAAAWRLKGWNHSCLMDYCSMGSMLRISLNGQNLVSYTINTL